MSMELIIGEEGLPTGAALECGLTVMYRQMSVQTDMCSETTVTTIETTHKCRYSRVRQPMGIECGLQFEGFTTTLVIAREWLLI